VLIEYFKAKKGDGSGGDFLAQCSEAEMPNFITEMLASIKDVIEKPEQSNLAPATDTEAIQDAPAQAV